jgi:hypothetical protein
VADIPRRRRRLRQQPYAEMMMKLVGLGLPAAQVSAFTSDLLAEAGRRMFGASATVELMPAGSTKRRGSDHHPLHAVASRDPQPLRQQVQDVLAERPEPRHAMRRSATIRRRKSGRPSSTRHRPRSTSSSPAALPS